ncbi:uncharacterized protein LOC135071555 [Ostrinia nubilalis]|uniref:uncharacterized protein LOC114365058 n=1 Tax=Ostrinia furnacalis TaxID=93504 RepID=UPI001038FD38|nr:uncharacterized protein LOC114365058 [Ostrinia furnacalis]
MLAPALVVLTLTTARAFKITSFHVPPYVPPDQTSVDIECRYDANFTILNWFKGSTEFFRYKPTSTPSTRSFPILGVGTIDLISCGPTECRLRLGQLTEEASGLYRCDLELDKPPYKFESKTGYMKVVSRQHRQPVVEGLSDEYGEDEEIQAYCRAENNAQVRWYLNGKEALELRGNRTLKLGSKQINSLIAQPTVTVQCAEYIDGKLIGSKDAQAKWKKTLKTLTYEDQACSMENSSNAINSKLLCLLSACVLCLHG